MHLPLLYVLIAVPAAMLAGFVLGTVYHARLIGEFDRLSSEATTLRRDVVVEMCRTQAHIERVEQAVKALANSLPADARALLQHAEKKGGE